MVRRRWTQFNLKSLMAAVVLICLGLGGWQMLMTFGQYIEAEPAVVGQPIKIHGRFFHFGKGDMTGHYKLVTEDARGGMVIRNALAESVGWFRYDIDVDMGVAGEPTEIKLTLMPEGGSPIRGSFVVRAAD